MRGTEQFPGRETRQPMAPCASASSPGHLSGYFRPVYGPTPAGTGSVGAGIGDQGRSDCHGLAG